jgi:hypothetical protein
VLCLLYCVGRSEALKAAIELTRGWGYATLQHDEISTTLPPLPFNTIVLSEIELAGDIRAIWPGNLSLIVLKPEDTAAEIVQNLPEGTLTLSLPLRPAKLRALLSQIQNTSSKSMP